MESTQISILLKLRRNPVVYCGILTSMNLPVEAEPTHITHPRRAGLAWIAMRWPSVPRIFLRCPDFLLLIGFFGIMQHDHHWLDLFVYSLFLKSSLYCWLWLYIFISNTLKAKVTQYLGIISIGPHCREYSTGLWPKLAKLATEFTW